MTADRAVSFSRFHHSTVSAGILALMAFPLIAGCGHHGGPPRAAVRGEVPRAGCSSQDGRDSLYSRGPNQGPRRPHHDQRGTLRVHDERWSHAGRNSIEIVPGLAENPLAGARDIKAAWTEYAKTVAARTPAGTAPKRPTRNVEWKVDVKSKGQNTFDFKLASQ